MSKFKAGDEVTPIIRPEWEALNQQLPAGPLPIFGNVYTVNGYDTPEDGLDFVFFKECHPKDSFDDRLFEKVVSDRVLSEELESVPEPFTI